MSASGLAVLVAGLRDDLAALVRQLQAFQGSPIVEYHRGADNHQRAELHRLTMQVGGLIGRLKPAIGHLKAEGRAIASFAGHEEMRAVHEVATERDRYREWVDWLIANADTECTCAPCQNLTRRRQGGH